jgi:hypothetical protein
MDYIELLIKHYVSFLINYVSDLMELVHRLSPLLLALVLIIWLFNYFRGLPHSKEIKLSATTASGDWTTGRGLYGKQYSFCINANPFIFMNECDLPESDLNDPAFADRVVYVKFDARFEKNDTVKKEVLAHRDDFFSAMVEILFELYKDPLQLANLLGLQTTWPAKFRDDTATLKKKVCNPLAEFMDD